LDFIEWVSKEIAEGHMMGDQVMDGLTSEVAHFEPGGTTNNIAQLMAHLTMGQDRAINVAIKGAQSVLEAGGWALKTGIPTERGAVWNKGWKLDLGAFADYRSLVNESVKAFIATAKEIDFEGEAQWGPPGVTRPKLWILGTPGTAHLRFHLGEISTIKGLQGLKGLPF
jgi:hypothetical protein